MIQQPPDIVLNQLLLDNNFITNMLQIKQQTQASTTKYAFATPITSKQYITRIAKQSNYDICRTLETEESITQPMTNRQPQPYAQYFNDHYHPVLEPTPPKNHTIQDLTCTLINKTIPRYEIQQLLRSMTMIRFLSGEVSSQIQFISKKEEVIREVKIQIEERQAEVGIQKKKYDRRVKKNNEKKLKLQKLDDLINKHEVREELQWTAKITHLRLKLKQKRQLQQLNQYYQPKRHLQDNHSHKKRRQNHNHTIHIPMMLPPQGQCYTARSHYDPRYSPYQYDFYSQVNEYNPEAALQYPPQFTRTASKNVSHQKFKTQSTDGFYTKRESKLAPRYLQDFDEQQRERQPLTDRKHSRKVQNQASNQVFSNMCLQGFRQAQHELISNMELGLYSNKKEQNNFKLPQVLKHQNNQPKSIPIKKIQSQTLSAEMSREQSKNQENNFDDLGVLLEQSISKEESKYIKTIGQKQTQHPFIINIPNQNKNAFSSSKQQQSFFKLQSADNHKLKDHNILNQHENHIIKTSPIKETHIKESTVKIQMSDQESSKINKREKQRSIYDEAQKKQYRESIAEVCALIEQESQQTSMRTTPNNQLSPKQVSENDKTASVTPTPSHSSTKPKASDGRDQAAMEQQLIPLAQPPNLKQVRDHEGISNIQLNMMSKQSRELPIRNQGPKRKDSDDDNLMTITLVGQSRISRLKTQFKAVLREEQIVLRNNNKVENRDKSQTNTAAHHRQKQIEKSSDLDLDFQLSAQSNYFSKSKLAKANQSISPKTNQPAEDQTNIYHKASTFQGEGTISIAK